MATRVVIGGDSVDEVDKRTAPLEVTDFEEVTPLINF